MLDYSEIITQYLKNIDPDNDHLLEYFNAYQFLLKKFGYDPKLEPGQINLLGWNLSYLCVSTLLGQIDATLVRGLNNFIPENDHPVILDCGSNIGLTVLNYKRKFPNSQIIAFEPDVNFLPVLRQNLIDNQISGVEVVDAAVWIKNDSIAWYQEGFDGSHIRAHDTGDVRSTHVRSIDLVDFLKNPVDLIKMDIEGAEYEVIRHIQSSLHNVKTLSIECHLDQKTVIQFGEMLSILRSNGFNVSIGSVGLWRDLVFQPHVDKDHHENYILVSAWQGEIPHIDSPGPWIHNVGVAPLLESINQIDILNKRLMEENDQNAKAMVEKGATLIEVIEIFAKEGESKIIRSTISPPFKNISNFGWIANLDKMACYSDNSENPNRSKLLLFENGKILQPGHCNHDEICNLGQGRYSHWNDVLYFSTSDGSDPNTNGRHYQLLTIKEK